MSSWLERLKLSPEQLAALQDPSPRILVAAGAGSGKTLLLTAFYLQALLEERLPVEKVVAVTFTRKAGAELVSRIRDKLRECGEADLARSLDSATIGTIHSLCHRLLRDNALAVGVDPAFGVLEAEAANLAKEQASRLAWKDAVEAASDEQLKVLATEGESLRTRMVALYDRLRGLGHMQPQVVVEPGPPADTRASLLACAEDVLAAGKECGKVSETLRRNLEVVAACREYFLQSHASREEEVLRATKDFFPSGNLPPHLKPAFTAFQEALTAHRATVARAPLERLVSTANLLLCCFDRRYREFKQARGLLDFADLELYAHQLVRMIEEQPERSAVLEGAWVLVDEFQDTNELQCAILERLGAARLIMVGDERQSIYRFRGAEVEVFRRRLKEMERGLHPLDVNYRSRPQLLAFIDRLFAHPLFFGQEMRALVPARSGEHYSGKDHFAAVEIVVVDREAAQGEDGTSSFREAEAQAVGQVVERLLHEEGISRKDIVVLVPAMLECEAYEGALVSRGVDVYVVGGKGYFSQEEISDMAALLQLLVNPNDDIALCAALRSPLVGLSDDGLYLLGRSSQAAACPSLWCALKGPSLEALPSEDRKACVLFFKRLDSLRPRVGRPGLARLVDEAATLFEYDLVLLESRDGRRRFANLRKLMRIAEEFEALNGPDLAGFVSLLKEMEELGGDEGNAPSVAEDEDVVRIMTVHQAKGLEFPVVVLAGLGGEAPVPKASDFVVGDEGRVGVFLKGSRHERREDHDLCLGPAVAILEAERLKAKQEDARLLYVAMTRARDRLILVGALAPGRDKRGRRIGQILEALDVGTLPSSGQRSPVDGLDAVVTGFEPTADGSGRSGSPESVSVGWSAERAVSGTRRPGLGPAGDETAAAHDQAAAGLLSFGPAARTLRQVSFSALAAYERCPRRFYLERILRVGGLLPVQDLVGQLEGVGERRLAAGGQFGQLFLGCFHAVGEGQGQVGALPPKQDRKSVV